MPLIDGVNASISMLYFFYFTLYKIWIKFYYIIIQGVENWRTSAHQRKHKKHSTTHAWKKHTALFSWLFLFHAKYILCRYNNTIAFDIHLTGVLSPRPIKKKKKKNGGSILSRQSRRAGGGNHPFQYFFTIICKMLCISSLVNANNSNIILFLFQLFFIRII